MGEKKGRQKRNRKRCFMAFDGFTVRALVRELSEKLTGSRIYKIAQPESDELLLTLRPMAEKGGGTLRLVLSADASLPLCYLTQENRKAPATAPAFCMLLRKHLQNARILSVEQPGLERIIRIRAEHLNEMGDLCTHTLVIELMGKHSNIILLDTPKDGSEQEVILDSIKHISRMVSSVREVLPGREYFVPETRGKKNPFAETDALFEANARAMHVSCPDLLVRSYTGFSKLFAEEVTWRAGLIQDRAASALSDEELSRFRQAFKDALQDAENGNFSPAIYTRPARDAASMGEPVEYAVLPLTMYRDLTAVPFDSVSALLESFYASKNSLTRIRQKSADLRHIVQTILERDVHKYDLQCRQLKDTDKREKYRIWGELLNTYGYSLPAGSSSADLENYYTGETVRVPLDPLLSPVENAKRYFERYTKLKRTRAALEELTIQVKAEIDQLRGIQNALEFAQTEGDLAQIRQELEESGFIHKHTSGKKKGSQKTPAGKPLHYVSSDGFDIYVGKNNIQNDELTFRFASASDIWFHANDMPGSHVILKADGKGFEEIPDRAFEEAAALAAYYSSGRSAGRVEIDYLERRNVKKPAGSRPGFVVYYTNYSILAKTDISGLRLVP